MIIIPTRQEPPAPTRRSRELGARFEEALREYRRQEPGLTDDEVRAATAGLVAPDEDAAAALRRRRIMVAGLAAAIGMVGAVISATRGAGGTAPTGWAQSAQPLLIAIIVALAFVAVAIRLRSRR